MKSISNLCARAVALGPVPYLLLSAAVFALGAVLQIRAGAVPMDGSGTIFGMFAKIGGCIGLIGLVIVTLRLPFDAESDHSAPANDPGPTESHEDEVVEAATPRDPIKMPSTSAIMPLMRRMRFLKGPALSFLKKRLAG